MTRLAYAGVFLLAGLSLGHLAWRIGGATQELELGIAVSILAACVLVVIRFCDGENSRVLALVAGRAAEIARELDRQRQLDVKPAVAACDWSRLIESSADGICIVDCLGRYTAVNSRLCDMLGFGRGDMLRRFIFDTCRPEECEKTRETVVRAFAGEVVCFECTILRGDGKELPMELSTVRLDDDALQVTYHDATAHRHALERAEQALREQLCLFEQLLAAMPSPVFFADEEGRYLGCNEAFEKVIGLKRVDLVGKGVHELWPQDLADVAHADDALCASPGAQSYEASVVYADGSRHEVVFHKATACRRDGARGGIVGVALDVTELKRAEHSAQAAHRESELFIKAVPSVLIGVDNQGRIDRWNPACEALFELSEAQVRGRPLKDCGIRWIDPELAVELDSWPSRTDAFKRENMAFDKNGERCLFSVTVNPVRFPDGSGAGLLITGADVTQRRQTEEQLRQTQKLDAVGQLAAGIANEISNPAQSASENTVFIKDSWHALDGLLSQVRLLSREHRLGGVSPATIRAVVGCAEEADLDDLMEETPKAIRQCLDGLERVSEVVRAMTEFSHPDPPGKSLVDINRVVETIVTVTRSEWKSVARLETSLDATLPKVPGQRSDLNHVILNLIVNAAHAIKDRGAAASQGMINILTRRRGTDVEVVVADNGTGIAPEHRSRVFDPFFSTKGVDQGSGHGLFVAHNIVVKKHRGKIWFETEKGQGTTFFVRVPIQPPVHTS